MTNEKLIKEVRKQIIINALNTINKNQEARNKQENKFLIVCFSVLAISSILMKILQ